MERRFIQQQRARVQVDKRADGQQIITGYAAVYYREGDAGTEYELWPAMGTYPRVVERIMRGAFDGRLTDDVRGLFNHDGNMLLGRSTAGTMSLSVDDVGLRYEIVAADTQVARDVLEMVRRGDLTGSSFSFSIGEQRWLQAPDVEVREIVSLGVLYDVGPVTFPAYEATTTGAGSRARRDDPADEARAAWDAWRKDRAALNVRLADYRARAAG